MAVQPLGDRQAAYDEMIEGCVEFYKEKGFRCREYEADRVRMSLRQAQSMEVSFYFACGVLVPLYRRRVVSSCSHNVTLSLSLELHRNWLQEDQDTGHCLEINQGVLGR
jgi:hypothetical protein